MKKLILSVFAMVALSVSGFAQSTVTQVTATVAENLPVTAEVFKIAANTALYNITVTDLPAIISRINTGYTGRLEIAAASLTTPGTGNHGILVTNWPTLVPSTSTNAPKWISFNYGTNTYTVQAWQTR